MIGEEIYEQIRGMLGECYLNEDSRENLVKYIESLRDPLKRSSMSNC